MRPAASRGVQFFAVLVATGFVWGRQLAALKHLFEVVGGSPRLRKCIRRTPHSP